MNSITPDVSIVIVSFNTKKLLAECLETAQRQQGVTMEIFVVDNASSDGSPAMVASEFPDVKLIVSEKNLGFAGANNLAFPQAMGRYVVLLNSDAFFVEPCTLQLAVKKMDADEHAGLAGGRLTGREGGWQPSARKFPSVLNDCLILTGLSTRFPRSRFFGRPDRTWADPLHAVKADWVPGAFSIIRRRVLEQIGFFDEQFFLYYEEVDLCRRIRAAGYSIWYWPDVVIVHLGGESSKQVKTLSMSSSGAQLTLWRMRSALLYYRKHHAAQVRLMMAAECCWHRLRAMFNRARHAENAEAKATESMRLVQLFEQAWQETQGGRVCPSRPW